VVDRPAGLGELPRLAVLYAHGNAFESFKAVAGLAGCTALRKLSLHGAPIENMPHYRVKVLALVPTVVVLDFTQVRASCVCLRCHQGLGWHTSEHCCECCRVLYGFKPCCAFCAQVTSEEKDHRLPRYQSGVRETVFRKRNGKPSVAPTKPLQDTVCGVA
jgi:hypothetical protein